MEKIRIFASLFAAAAIAATVFIPYAILTGDADWSWRTCAAWPLAFFVALIYAALFGLPAYFILKRRNLTQWWVSLVGGFMIGILPTSLLIVPGQFSPDFNSNIDNIPYVINGVMTQKGWISLISSLIGAGALGAVSAFAAWLVWKYFPLKNLEVSKD